MLNDNRKDIINFLQRQKLSQEGLFLFREYEAKREEITKWLGDVKNKKVLILGDTHIPFQNNDIIKKLLLQKERYDIVVLAGDMVDLYRLSFFRQEVVTDEGKDIEAYKELLEYIGLIAKKVVIITANHEKRLFKRYSDLLRDPKLLLRVMGNIKETFSQMENNKVKVLQDYWVKIGDTIICHPDWYSKLPMKTVRASEEHFSQMGVEFNAIFNAHVHRYNMHEYRNEWLCELPCLALVMDYMIAGKRTFKTMDAGWVWFKFNKDGKFDINSFGRYIEKVNCLGE